MKCLQRSDHDHTDPIGSPISQVLVDDDIVHVIVSFIVTLLLRSLLVLSVTFDMIAHFFDPNDVA
jgi:hypothetical protein